MPIALRSWNRGLPLHAESAALLPRRCRRESDKILHEAIVPLAREGVLLLPLNRAAHLWRWDTTDPSRCLRLPHEFATWPRARCSGLPAQRGEVPRAYEVKIVQLEKLAAGFL